MLVFVCLYWKCIPCRLKLEASRFGLFFISNSYLFHKRALIWHEAKGFINTYKDKQIIKSK